MTLHLERDLSSAPTGTWARFHVLDERGGLVGHVGEWHEDGRITFYAVHNPTGRAFEALWRSDGHATPQDALAALCDHLAGPVR